jgi:hypothetical protein
VIRQSLIIFVSLPKAKTLQKGRTKKEVARGKTKEKVGGKNQKI